MKKNILFIINPISGVGKKNILPGLIDKHLNHDLFNYELVYTQHQGHANELSVKAVEEGVDIVCIAGGDGSVNEGATPLINKNTILAILPVGSGNGIARHLGIPLKLKDAISRINKLQVNKIDTVIINDKKAIGVSGFGFDADIAECFNEHHTRGIFGYAQLVLQRIRKFKGFSIVVDGKEEHSDLLLFSIANTSQFGNGFTISPESNVNDGAIELAFVKTINFFQFIKIAIASLRGTIHKSKHISIVKVKEANIEVPNKLGHIDGEPVHYDSNNINIKCVPNSLSIIV